MWKVKKYFQNSELKYDEINVEDIIYLQAAFLKCFGLWTPENYDTFYYKLYYYIFQPLFISVLSVSQLVYLIKNLHSVEAFGTCFLTLPFLQSTVKIWIFRKNCDQMKNVIQLLGEKEFQANNNQAHFLQRSITNIIKLQLACLSTMVLAILIFIFVLIFSLHGNEHVSIIPAWYPFDIFYSPIYEIVSTAQIIGIFMVGSSVIICDIAALIYMNIVRLQLKILNIRIVHTEASENDTENTLLELQIKNIQFHQKIIK